MLSSLTLADAAVRALRTIATRDELVAVMKTIAREIGCRYYALVRHDDLWTALPNRVDIRDYPAAVFDRLFQQCRYRRDPIIRGFIFADGAFLLFELDRIVQLDRHDRESFAIGAYQGLNEGITVPHVRLGECMESTTLARMRHPENARHYLVWRS